MFRRSEPRLPRLLWALCTAFAVTDRITDAAVGDMSVARIVVDTTAPYSSTTWPVEKWSELKELRDLMGTMNGPREIYPVQDNQPVYNTTQYLASFAGLSAYAVRFNDLNYGQGGTNSTSITQIFTAWPLSDTALDALSSAEIAALASDESNYVWTGLDYNVGAACDANISLMDFRIGDTWHVANDLNTGAPVPMANGTLSFPAEWKFATNVLTSKGVTLWAAVATKLAMRVHTLCGQQNKLVFDILTEIYVDSTGSGHFFPHNGTVYATLFGAVTKSIKAALSGTQGGAKVLFGGPNVIPTNTANKNFFNEFIGACAHLGYADCPLDVATFHFFSTDSGRGTSFASWVHSKLYSQFHGTSFPVPRMAISAWGLAPSGKYAYNADVAGAAYLTSHMIEIQSTPIDFAIFYKFDGINCDAATYPCLVQGTTGKLKPNAAAFQLHAKLLQSAQTRLAAKCYRCAGGAYMAAISNTTATLGVLLAGTGTDPAVPQQLLVKHWNAMCNEESSTLSVWSASVGEEAGTGTLVTSTVSGTIGAGNAFYQDGKPGEPYTLPISTQASDGAYAALVTLRCG